MHISNRRYARCLWLALSALAIAHFALGCAAPDDGSAAEDSSETGSIPGDGSEIESSDHPVLSGTSLTQAEIAAIGLVDVPLCSGVLLSSRLVLTALHCVPAGAAQVTVSFLGTPNTGIVQEISPGRDMAVIAFANPFVDPTTGQAWVNRSLFWEFDLAPLAGTNVVCYGRGDTLIFSGFPLGFGAYNRGTYSVWNVEGRGLRVGPGPAGQISMHGDSGGPCFLEFGSNPRALVAMHSSMVETFNDANMNGALDPGEVIGVDSAWLGGVDASTTAWYRRLIRQFP